MIIKYIVSFFLFLTFFSTTLSAITLSCAPENMQEKTVISKYVDANNGLVFLNWDAESKTGSNESVIYSNLGKYTSESLWDISYAADGKLYGVIFNILVEINPSTGELIEPFETIGDGDYRAHPNYELVGDQEGYLYTVDEKNGRKAVVKFLPSSPSNTILVAYVDSLGLVGEGDLAWSDGFLYWTATTAQGSASQLVKIDVDSGSVSAIMIKTATGATFTNADALFNDSKGNLYFAAQDYIYNLDKTTGTATLSHTLTYKAGDAGGATTTHAFCASQPTPIVTIADYHFDECSWDGAAGEVKDSSGNGFDGQAINSANTNRDDGQVNGSGQFVGDDDAIRVEGITGLDSNDFTLSFWTKIVADGSSTHELIKLENVNANNTNNGDGGVVELRYRESDDELRVSGERKQSDGSVNGYSQTVTVDLNDGAWHHIVLTYQDENMKIFVDTSDADMIHPTNGISGVSNLGILDDFNGVLRVGNSINGLFSTKAQIDEVKLYAGAMSSDMISTLHTNEKSGKNADGSDREAVTCGVPFICDDTMYFSNGSPLGTSGSEDGQMYLHSINRSQSPFSFTPIGDAYAETYNALAYNPKDNFLYATVKNKLLKIDKNGVIEDLDLIVGLNSSQYYAGAFDQDGFYYLAYASNDKNHIYKVDLSTKTVVRTITMNKNYTFYDMTINQEGKLYFMEASDAIWKIPGQLYSINLLDSDTQTPVKIGIGVEGEDRVDGIFCDATNRLFVLYKTDGFYEVDLANDAKRIPISSAPSLASLNDGAMCPNATVKLKPTITIGDVSVDEGGNLVFPITLTNNTDPTSFTFKYQAFDGNDTNSKLNATLGTDFTADTYPTEVVQELAHNTTITIPTLQDTKVEADESLHLVLSDISGALYHDSNLVATGTIIDDDKPQGNCYATTDNKKELYIYEGLNTSGTLVNPKVVTLSKNLYAEGGAYRAVDGYLYQFTDDGDTAETYDEDKGSNSLYKINITTGEVTLEKSALVSSHVDAAEFYYDLEAKKDIFYVIQGQQDDGDDWVAPFLHAYNPSDDWKELAGYPKELFKDDGHHLYPAGLAIDPYTGKAYAMRDYEWDDIDEENHVETYENDTQKPVLYELDLKTGVGKELFRLPSFIDAEGLAFANDGNLYVENEDLDPDGTLHHKIFKVDLATQTITSVANSGTSGSSADIETLSCDAGVYQAPPIFEIITPEVMITEGSSLDANSKPLINIDENVTIVIKSSRPIRASDHYAGENGIRLSPITTIDGTATQSGDENSDFSSMDIAEVDRTMLDKTDMLILSVPMIKADKYIETDEYFQLYFSIINQNYNKVTFRDGHDKAKVTIIDDDYNSLTAYDHGTNYANPVIHSKIVNKPFALRLVSLKPTGGYATTFGDLNNTKVKLVDSSECVEKVEDLNMSGFTDFTITEQEVTKWFTISKAAKNMKVQFYWEDKYAPRTSCSEDSFAVRPKTYKIDLPSNLIAGKDFNITISALDQGNQVIENYEEDADVYKLDINESKVLNGCTLGVISKQKGDFVAGKSTVVIKYSDVGILDFNVQESNTTLAEYAHIDADDAPYANGSFGETRFIESVSASSSEINPASVDLETIFNTDASDDIVFYAGNSDSTKDETKFMAAKLSTIVKAKDAEGNMVENFKKGCYAKDVDISLKYHTLGEHNLTSVVLYDDENASTTDSYAPSQSSTVLGSNSMAFALSKDLFQGGVGSELIRINFHREKNRALNPMRMEITEVNASIGVTALSDVKVPANPAKTFLYMKAHVASSQSAVGKSKDVKVNYEFYRDDNADVSILSSLGLDQAKESEDEVNWFIIDPALSSQLNYNFTTKKPKALGNHTVYSSAGGPSMLSAGTTLIEHPDNSTMRISVGKLPYHDKIVYSPDREYLKYDRFNANVDVHSFKIHLVSDQAKWTGKGGLGMTVDEKVSAGNGAKKLDW